LLECFIGRHGVRCPICQKEVIFCYLQSKRGKKPAQIREAMAKGKAWTIDVSKETEKLYPQVAPAVR
jgi:hypothetical protein